MSRAQVDSTSTVPADQMQSREAARRGLWFRRTAVGSIALFVLTGALNVWGPRQGVTSAEGDRHRIEVTSPSVTRGGLPASWQLTAQRLDGGPLGDDVVVSVDVEYLAIFDQHALAPTPTETWSDGERAHWRFALPDGIAEFAVTLDARVQPDQRWRHRGTVEVRVGGDVITTRVTTWLVP